MIKRFLILTFFPFSSGATFTGEIKDIDGPLGTLQTLEMTNVDSIAPLTVDSVSVEETNTQSIARAKRDVGAVSTRVKRQAEPTNVQTFDDVEGLLFTPEFCSNSLLYVIPDFSNFLPNLKLITIDGCPIESIDKDTLAPYPDLEGLIIKDGKLTFIPSDLLDSLPNMKIISFEGNEIACVGDELPDNLDSLQSLEFLYFEDNVCTDSSTFAITSSEISDVTQVLRESCICEPR